MSVSDSQCIKLTAGLETGSGPFQNVLCTDSHGAQVLTATPGGPGPTGEFLFRTLAEGREEENSPLSSGCGPRLRATGPGPPSPLSVSRLALSDSTTVQARAPGRAGCALATWGPPSGAVHTHVPKHIASSRLDSKRPGTRHLAGNTSRLACREERDVHPGREPPAATQVSMQLLHPQHFSPPAPEPRGPTPPALAGRTTAIPSPAPASRGLNTCVFPLPPRPHSI